MIFFPSFLLSLSVPFLSYLQQSSLEGNGNSGPLKFHCVTGRAEWMDKGHKKCLILWMRIQDWADYIVNFVCPPLTLWPKLLQWCFLITYE